MIKLGKFHKFMLAALSALALLLAGVGPGLVSRAAMLDPALVAYLDSGGSLSDLCIGAQGTPLEHGQSCKDCTLCKIQLHPAAAAMRGLPALSHNHVGPVSRPNVFGVVPVVGPPVRAPPHLSSDLS